MLKRASDLCNVLVSRCLPDPFVLVALMTLLVFAGGVALTPTTPAQMLGHWGGGFWNLLTIAMQMALVLLTGHVLASTPAFQRLLTAMARRAGTPARAIVAATLVSLAASWINWGFGLVIGAIFAKELARRVPGVDYPLLIASAYSGFVVWHAGLSGSVPLTVATPGHFLESTLGVIPTSQTIFAPFNLMLVALVVVLVPLVNRALGQTQPAVRIDPADLEATSPAAEPGGGPARTPAERLEHACWVSWLVGGLGLAYTAQSIAAQGFQLNLNVVNFIFLFAGILLHGTPRRFIDATVSAVQGCAGILVQFPFYAGLAGMLAGSGLVAMASNAFIAVSTAQTLPLFAFLSAGLVNIFMPSGGGQWAVQGPIVIEAAHQLGASVPKTLMAVAWGDAWTNLIQPFWALPALAIVGLRARDIMGYCLVILMVVGVVIGLGLCLLPG